MNMGKRLKQELHDRGMLPVQLCALVPDLDIGTLSAIYTRDSRGSKFAPAIAQALGLELHWLITGEGEKFSQKDKRGDRQSANYEPSEVIPLEVREIAAAYAAAPDEVKRTIQMILRASTVGPSTLHVVETHHNSDNHGHELDDAGSPHPFFPNTTMLTDEIRKPGIPKRRGTD